LPPPEATPPPPGIELPRGELPGTEVGLGEWRIDRDESRILAGSGFLLRLPGGVVIAVTTAHSLGDLGASDSALEQVEFLAPDDPAVRVACDSLFGVPGSPRMGMDLSGDYVFLTVPTEWRPDPEFILEPDPRPYPQPGERVLLYPGISENRDSTRFRAGTVQTASSEAVWVLMDDVFDAALMSGSPLLSGHTGRVVGMAVAQMPRRGALMIGFHPIGSLLDHAARAEDVIPIAGFFR
jgi:hypothetical protein